ncbi:MAG: SH3 domain-containing protein, partial [Cyanobacteriota bacterium]
MESLAYIHAAVAYEDPNSAPELQVSLEIPSSVWLGTLSTAVVVSAVGGVAPEAQAVVRFGDTCIQVGDVQSALASAGFSPGSIDSVFGSNTLSAVRRFQLSKGLAVDGVVGPATASSLGLSGSIYNVGVSCGTGGPIDDGGPDFVRVSTNGSPLTVRNGPGTGFAPIDYLSNGTVVRVVGSSGGWYNISGGGWISRDWTVESGDDGDGSSGGGGNYFVSTNGGTLLVRNGPGTGFAVVGELLNGTSVTIVETSGGWGRLSGGG